MQLDRALRLLSVPPRLRYGCVPPGDVAGWAGRVRTVVRRALDLDRIEPFEVVDVRRATRGHLQVEEYVFRAHGRRDFRGCLVRPDVAAAGTPAVLVCPGRNAELDRVTGARPPDYEGRDVGVALADAGIATLTCEYGLTGAIPDDILQGRDETSLLALALGLSGRSLLGLLAEDALCGLAWLAAQPWVGPGRVGIFGHSLGAHVALHAALASSSRIPTALASFLTSYPSLFARRGSAGGAHALPGIFNVADLPDLVAAAVPGPLQIQIGNRDESLPLAEALAASDTARRAYADAGASDRLDVHVAEMGHSTDTTRACAFFGRWLGEKSHALPADTRVPAARIHFGFQARREILDRIDDSLATGSLTLGPNGRSLEELVARCTGSPHAVALSSGTAAIETALRVNGIAGHTVLVPANTFFATALAAMHAGNRVRFVDIEPDGLGMDPRRLRRELDRSADVAAVIIVHIGGIVAESSAEVLAVCRERNIIVIEDAAHALGSTLSGRPAGSFGDCAAFSMYPTKIATSAEGGMLTTSCERSATLARLLRDQGKESFHQNVHRYAGYNWRMSEVHASIGIAHLERLPEILDERRRQARIYDELLEDCPGVRPFRVPRGAESNYYKYIAVLDAGLDRDSLKSALRSRHLIELSGEVYGMPCFAQPYFQDSFAAEDFPRASEFCRRHICLPVFTGLSRTDQEAVVGALRHELSGISDAAAASRMER